MDDNNSGSNTTFYTLFIALGVGLVSGFFIGLTVGIALAVISGIIAYYFLNKQAKQPEPTTTDKDSDSDSGPSLNKVLDALAELNLSVRLESVNEKALSSIEQTIDDLIVLLPRVESELEEGELKWVVYRIATDYLPKRAVLPYIALDKAQQENTETIDNLINGLQAMQEELKEIDTLISQKSHAEFQAKAKFLQHRFNL